MQEYITPNERQEALRTFIETDPSFACSYGRDAMKAGTVSMHSLTDTPDFQKRVEEMISGLQDGFAQREKDVCMFVLPYDHINHWLEYFRTWVLYAQMHTATEVLSYGDKPDEVAPLAIQKARYFFSNPETFQDPHDYAKRGVIPFQGNDQLMVMTTGPAYDEGHPRRTPVSAFTVTRLTDGSKVRRENITRARGTLVNAWKNVEMPYNPTSPYVIPNDIRFAPPCYPKMLAMVTEVLSSVPKDVIDGDPLKMAKDFTILVIKQMQNTDDGVSFETQNITEATLLTMLRDGGYIKILPTE